MSYFELARSSSEFLSLSKSVWVGHETLSVNFWCLRFLQGPPLAQVLPKDSPQRLPDQDSHDLLVVLMGIQQPVKSCKIQESQEI